MFTSISFIVFSFLNSLSFIECSCIKPLILDVKSFSADGSHTLNRIPLFSTHNNSLSDVEKINEYIATQVYNDENEMLRTKIQLLEFAINHASSSTTCQPHSGEVYLSLKNREDLIQTSKSILNTIDILVNESFYPLKIWTPNTDPTYKIVLYGDDEFISTDIRVRGYFGPVDIARKIIKKSRLVNKLKGSNSGRGIGTGGVFIDVGANIGSVALYAAALGTIPFEYHIDAYTNTIYIFAIQTII